jgi:predicted alpha/beta-hydrolase family hydrolase
MDARLDGEDLADRQALTHADVVRVPVGARTITASVHGGGDTALVLFHGAGGNRRTPFLVTVADALAAAGHRVLLGNFPYTEDGRKAPDKPDVLEAAVDAVATHAERELGARRVVLGGKSMGGRMASQLAAKGRRCAGLVFLGYPLHPPGREDTPRDAHLPRIEAPMLFVQGTRDDFARWDLIEAVARRLGPRATLHRVEGADHSFKVLKREGRTAREVEAEIVSAITRWVAALDGRPLSS